MLLKARTCPSCGAKINAFKDKVLTTCLYCGAIIEEIDISDGNKSNVKERLLKNARSFLSFGDVEEAYHHYAILTNRFPDFLQGWLEKLEVSLDYNNPSFVRVIDAQKIEPVLLKLGGQKEAEKLWEDFIQNIESKIQIVETKVASHELEERVESKVIPFVQELLSYDPSLLCERLQNLQQQWIGSYVKKIKNGELFYPGTANHMEIAIKIKPPSLKEGFDFAKIINKLSRDKFEKFLKMLGINQPAYLYYRRCEFVLGKSICFGENSTYAIKTELNIDGESMASILKHLGYDNISADKEKEMNLWINNYLRYAKDKTTVLKWLIPKLTNYSDYQLRDNGTVVTSIKKLSFYDNAATYPLLEYEYSFINSRIKPLSGAVPNHNLSCVDAYRLLQEYVKLHHEQRYVCKYCGGELKGFLHKVCCLCNQKN